MNNINERAPKAEIISAAVEALDYHINENNRLKQQQIVLAGISAFLLIITIL